MPKLRNSFARACAVAPLVACALAVGAARAAAQRPDSARARTRADSARTDSVRAGAPRPASGPVAAPAAGAARDTVPRRARRTRAVAADSVNRPPITPKHAFLRSLALPGWGQASLNRGAAGAAFVSIELASVAMIYKSNADLARARRYAHDSVFTGYQLVDSTVNGITIRVPKLDSLGRAIGVYQPNALAVRVQPRKQHREDWIALLLANHLFAGADAFVAAHLWDLPGKVAIRAMPRGAELSAQLSW